ncbi:TolC family protein [Phocaeicola paurosaccharolyticus]|uniref:TolC family protein n=1 Tax=Phocaeicola paurosaccharolyticus TaxID=732242 RepID=UPI0005552029|nr:TolC family protein [Phocaeicola paurosaccharolyticus]
MRKLLYIYCLMVMTYGKVHAQQLTLTNAIRISQENSFDAKLAQFQFTADYWTYRSFRAELLPAVNLSGGLMNFNHSRVEARDAETGKINYVDNNSMTNNLMLSVDQQLPSLGGTLSLQSYLNRLDQFNYDLKTYNSQPLRLSYTQPLRSYNALKWQKKIAPKEYERAKKVYLEGMESVAIQTTNLFFSAITAQSNYNQDVAKLEDLTRLYDISLKRFELGTITKSDILQLELSKLNAKVAVTNSRIQMDNSLFSLFSYMGVRDYQQVRLIPPSNVTDITVTENDILSKALENSSHQISQDLTLLAAKQNLASAKSAKGIQLQLNGEIGFNQTADNFSSAYSHLRDNEIVGLTLAMPIFDWGVKKGRVKVAQSKLELAKTQIERAEEEYVQNIRQQALQFSFQAEQCRTSMRAQDISKERYEITKKRFETGTVSVTELNTAMQEQETAKLQYIGQLQLYWSYYYTLRKATLYDWVDRRNLTADFDKIVKRKF